jgi:hypothetical protein
MIDDKIWTKKLALTWDDNMCIACVETRIGRRLTPQEVGFAYDPGVEGYPKSDLLISRARPNLYDNNGKPKPVRPKKKIAKKKAKVAS